VSDDSQIADQRQTPLGEVRDGEARMSIVEHLQELRVRLLRAAIALMVGFILAYA